MRALCWAGLIVVMTVSTAQRAHIWGRERALWLEAVAHSPAKPRPWINLGVEHVRDGAKLSARQAYHTAIALSRDPRRERVEGPMRARHVALLNLALLEADAGRYDEAFALTAQIQPRATQAVNSIVTRVEAQWRAEQTHGGLVPF